MRQPLALRLHRDQDERVARLQVLLMRKVYKVYITVAGSLLVVGLAGFGLYARATSVAAAKSRAQAGPKAVPVLVASAETKDVPVILRGLGTVQAFNTAPLKSQVGGAVMKLNFKEGQDVRTGDLLIQLDARPYQAVLDQAKATLAKDQASLANAKTDLQRYSKLLQQNFTPEQQYATQVSAVAQGVAADQSDEAAINAAQLNVDYASIKSPIDGVTGIRQVDIGVLVQANSQTLVTVTQIQPIYVIFTLPEANIGPIRDAMAQGQLSIQAFAANDEKQIAEGVLDLVDNAVDQTTGTVKLKAEFANKDKALWPGEFVNAHLVLKDIHNGVTVPAVAIQTGPSGSYVYLVKDDSTVDRRSVTVVQTDNNIALVGSGLQAGERVVTAGQFKLDQGTKVQISDNPADVGPSVASDTPTGVGSPQ
jgi:membrane fusion protein, multidrug efflux system